MKLYTWVTFAFSLSCLSILPCKAQLDADTFDSIISSVARNLSHVQLPDFEVGFKRYIFHGRIKVFNINVSGLDTIRRSGPVTMETNSDGDTKIEVKVALGFLRFSGSSKVQFMGIGPSRGFKGSVAYIDASTKLTLLRDGRMVLNEFKLKDLDDTSLTLEGPLITVDFITNTALKLVLSNFTNSIKWVLERVIARVISNKVSDQEFIDTLLNNT